MIGRPLMVALRLFFTHGLVLIDLELRVSIVAEDLFELEYFTRPVIFEQDHLHVAVRLHTGQRCSKFANRHRGVLISAKGLPW
jgi:hypothetical protein